MPMRHRFSVLLLLLFPVCWTGAATLTVEHDLQVALTPAESRLQVRDRLRLPAGAQRIVFALNADLDPRVADGTARLASLGRSGDFERFVLVPETGVSEVTLSYGGPINFPLQEVAESLGRSHQRSQGIISAEGVFLGGSSGWYPWVADSLQRFRIEVTVPAGWLAVSQGDGPQIRLHGDRSTMTWVEQHPQDDIYLIAAPFNLHRLSTPVAEAQIYLRDNDQRLAQRYLTATERYLNLYSKLIGDYPYAKFALVENFWPTGYGMPSFTLLGSRVLRLPFIIDTSYPHEILHNWWGNGVFVDYTTGNWSEGLTTYLADHLIKEQGGRGPAYRRDALQGFTDYVRTGQDFPLSEFRGRHSSASQSVGYGRGFMLFHMLRQEVGDTAFIDGLRRFYRDHRFRTAGYGDLQQAFETAAGRPLDLFFGQWLTRTGAPRLAVRDVTVQPSDGGYRLDGRLAQVQAEAPFRLQVPLVVRFAQGEPLRTRVVMDNRYQPFTLNLPDPPLRLDVDPYFDLFRTLHPEESPPSLSALFGSGNGLILLPSRAPAALREGYRRLATTWTQGYDGWEVQDDRETTSLPTDRPVWVLGWENLFRADLAPAFQRVGAALEVDGARLPEAAERLDRDANSVVLVAPGETAEEPPRAFLGAHLAQALPGLTRKLPHYGKYGYLAFQGEAPDNTFKGQWQMRDSPLSVVLAEGAAPPLPKPPALTRHLAP